MATRKSGPSIEAGNQTLKGCYEAMTECREEHSTTRRWIVGGVLSVVTLFAGFYIANLIDASAMDATQNAMLKNMQERLARHEESFQKINLKLDLLLQQTFEAKGQAK